ncbi:MAG: L-histidine N(alpha)-methyltransferase [Pseudomonadota bacterium]
MNNEFLQDVLVGFAKQQKSLSPKWLYDERGSELFEKITKTEDYYVTRTEESIMRTVLGELPGLLGPASAITEFGSGAGIKSQRLIEAIKPSVYVMVDVADEFLRASAKALSARFPDVEIHGVLGDFLGEVAMPSAFLNAPSRVGFFPGSTIGNFDKGGAEAFLAGARRDLGHGSRFLLGADLVKDEEVLIAAYDDRQHLTAEFTLNLLRRINRELEASINVETFRHLALWNNDERRIEIYAEAQAAQELVIADETFRFAKGERLHVENSHKFTRGSMTRIAARAGWDVEAYWTDPLEWFGVFLLKAQSSDEGTSTP